MHTSTLLLSLLPLALAQYGDSGSAATTTASSAGTATTTAAAISGVTTVKVSNANGDLTFTPDNFTAPVGQVIEFLFYPKTHSVAQAAFATPCEPLANNTGFFSGGFTTASGTNADVFTITVNDTKPIWFYCGYPTHCEAGMVGVINPPADGSKTIDEFKAAAAKVSNTVAPTIVQGGTKQPVADVKGSGTVSSSSSSTSSTSTSTSKPNAGVESRGGVKWALLAVTGLIAAGVSSLIL